MESKALQEALANALDKPFQMGWQTARSMKDACWSLQMADRPSCYKAVKEGISAFAPGEYDACIPAGRLPDGLYWLGSPMKGAHALQVFCCDALEKILERDADLASAIAQAPAARLEELDWPEGYPAWLPSECLRFALRNWKACGQTRDQAPGEAMAAAFVAGDEAKLARLMAKWGPLAPMSIEEDEDCCFWKSISDQDLSMFYDTFARRALLEWGACEDARAALEAAGVDFAAPFPGSDASWADTALLLNCRQAYEGLGGRMDDPDRVARAAVAEADGELLKMALEQGADPMPLLAESLTKDRALSGSSRMRCAKLLIERGASASAAVDGNGTLLLEAFLDGWELWETYLDESGLALSDFVPQGLSDEEYGRLALKAAKGIWEVCLNGPSSMFDDPPPAFPDLKPGRETMDYVDALLGEKRLRPPGWAMEVWPALRARLEKSLISGDVGSGAKGKPSGKMGGI